MAHFARVQNGVVKKVHVVANEVLLNADGVEQESLGAEFLAGLHGGDPAEYIQTSYNGTIRKNYAGVGFTYDEVLDGFIPPRPQVGDWELDEETCLWVEVVEPSA